MRILYLHGFASGPASKKAAFFRARIPGLEVPELDQGDFEHMTISGQLAVIECLAAAEPVALIGSSMGGYLAALYASYHPEVSRLVLLAPAFGFVRRWVTSTEAAEWRRTGWLGVFHYGEKRTRQLSYQLIEDGLQYEDFPDFRQPALIFHGVHDNVVSPQASHSFAGTHPNARLHLLDSAHELIDVLDTIWLASGPFLVG